MHISLGLQITLAIFIGGAGLWLIRFWVFERNQAAHEAPNAQLRRAHANHMALATGHPAGRALRDNGESL